MRVDSLAPRGRYAPSPTGALHLGNASTALLAWLSIRARGGAFVMRMEDLDGPRVVPGLAARILHDLTWLGLDWDEGPDRGGPYGPYEQTARSGHYSAAFERLRGEGCVYACFCSRRDIQAAASAPQAPGDELRYPGSCRGIESDRAARRIAEGERHAWRFASEACTGEPFEDRVRGRQDAGTSEPPDDFVVWRSDGVPAYQLAVVVDDAAMRIDEVVRGDDLLPSTSRQLRLYRALGQAAPSFGHVPLLLGTDRIRLSKRHRGITLAEMRDAGWSAGALVGRLAWLHGLIDRPEIVAAADLVPSFTLARVRRATEGIVVDPASWV